MNNNNNNHNSITSNGTSVNRLANSLTNVSLKEKRDAILNANNHHDGLLQNNGHHDSNKILNERHEKEKPVVKSKPKELDDGYVEFVNLPNQVYRKAVKKGFEFTLMVVAYAPSPRINVSFIEPAVDVSFEAYKQLKCSNNRKRSFSPIGNFRSPDISPITLIEVGHTFRVASSANTPEVKKNPTAYYQKAEMNRRPVKGFFNTNLPAPEKRKVSYMIGTPLAKHELEPRISVANILRDLNLAKHVVIFNDEEINFGVFLTLSEKHLHDIGIDCQRDIELILGKVAEYNAGL